MSKKIGISNMISEKARHLYFVINNIPGWLPRLSRFTGDSEEDLHSYADFIDGIESDYNRNHKPNVFDFRYELEVEHKELRPQSDSKLEITIEMIQRAKEFPITELIVHKRMWALCPFHQDTNPSLFLKNNFFHCFVCEKSGDTIDLVKQIYNVDFKTAVKVLNN